MVDTTHLITKPSASEVPPALPEYISPIVHLLNKQAAADILGVSEKTLDNWASSKAVDLVHVKVGRLRKYRVSDLQDFISNNLHGGGAE